MSEGQENSQFRCLIIGPDRSDQRGPLPGLEGALPLDRRTRLMDVLLERAADWCSNLSDQPPVVTNQAGLLDAAQGAEAVVVVRPALAHLAKSHADDITSDLSHGCGLIVGPTLVGGWYALVLSPYLPELLKAAGDGQAGSAGMLLTAASQMPDLSAGMLRAERNLETPADLASAQVDPIVSEEIAALIRG